MATRYDHFWLVDLVSNLYFTTITFTSSELSFLDNYVTRLCET